MKWKLSILLFVALAALGWLGWRSGSRPAGSLPLAAPPPEKLAELDSAEIHAAPLVEQQAEPGREALEVRTIQTRGASIEVHPPKVASENRGMLIVWCYLAGSHASVDPAEIVLVSPEGRELRQTHTDHGTIRGLGPGPFSLIVRDARFEELRVDSIATGSHVMVELVGTSRLRLRAFDAETGTSIAASDLRLLDFGREGGLPPDSEGWFSGLLGGDVKLRVTARGYEVARLMVPGLRPGESREAELRLSLAGEIHGVVLASDGTPRAKVRVVLRPAEDSGAGRQPAPRAWFPVSSDAQGRFEFRDLPFGDFLIGVEQGTTPRSTGQSVHLSASARIADVVLRVPLTCSLTGTLTCASSGAPLPSFAGAGLMIVPLGETGKDAGPPVMTNVRPNGTFAVGDWLPVARVQLRLLLRPGASERVLGELDLHAGLNECSFDISELCAGSATFEIAAPGVEIDGGELLVTERDGGADLGRFGFTGRTGTLGPLPAGEFRLLARGENWYSATPVEFRIENGSVANVRVVLRLVRGRVVVQDAEGAPLSGGTRVTVRRSIAGWPGSGAWITAELDKGGELELALEPGPYLLLPGEMQLLGDADLPAFAFEWTAAGPAQPALRLPAGR